MQACCGPHLSYSEGANHWLVALRKEMSTRSLSSPTRSCSARGPFYLGPSVTLCPKEIVSNVQLGHKVPFRPLLEEDCCSEELAQMIRKCWAEDPAERPDFQTLKPLIRRLNK
ncbi:hypothetical protein MRX96_023345 [Rhipicephalus microplus]